MTQRAIADIHGVTARTVRRWTRLGMPRAEDGRYAASETIAWRLQRRGRWCPHCQVWHG